MEEEKGPIKQENVETVESDESDESVKDEMETDCFCGGPPVSDSVAIVDMVFDGILDLVMYMAVDDGPMEANDTLHDSSPWEDKNVK